MLFHAYRYQKLYPDQYIKNHAPFKPYQKVLVTIPSRKVYNIASGQHEVMPEQKKYAFVAENT